VPSKIQYREREPIEEHFDALIIGSDQIWRKDSSSGAFDGRFFGDGFLDYNRLISYSASMGIVSFTEDDIKYLTHRLRRFSKISVRERALADRLFAMGFDVSVTMDPVFLLKKHDWISRLSLRPIRTSGKPYLFFYNHNYSRQAIRLVKRISKLRGLKVIEVNSFVRARNMRNLFHNAASPRRFLELMLHSDYVVTTSFHGAAFSVLFNKPFVALGMDHNFERVGTLLETTGLERFYISASQNVELFEPCDIDYSYANTRIASAVAASVDYLDLALR